MSGMEAHLEVHSDSHAYGNATEVVWALPRALQVLGIVLVAHGCKQTPRVWMSEGGRCLKCIPRPEEVCMTQKALDAGYAVVGIGNLKGTKGCWEREDVPSVVRTLNKWRSKHNLQRENGVPLYALGVGSGGWMAANAARVWPDVRAVSVQASVPSLKDVQRPQTGGETKPYPPLQMVLMERDAAKRQSAEVLLGQDWAGKARAETLIAKKKTVGASFFSDGIKGLRLNVSQAVRAALVTAGVVDERTSALLKMPTRSELRDKVSNAMGSRKTDFPQRSKQLALDGIFARLDMAYAQEASTCEYMDRTLAFFTSHRGEAPVTLARAHHAINSTHHSHGNHSHSTAGGSHHHAGAHHTIHTKQASHAHHGTTHLNSKSSSKTHSKKGSNGAAAASPPPPAKSLLSRLIG